VHGIEAQTTGTIRLDWRVKVAANRHQASVLVCAPIRYRKEGEVGMRLRI
jgi:hypothetical protein